MYTNAVLGEGKCVLFREVSLIRGVTVYAHLMQRYSW